MDAAAESGGNPMRETKFSGANGNRQKFIFSFQLTTSRIGNLTWLISPLLCAMTIHTVYYPVIYLYVIYIYIISIFF